MNGNYTLAFLAYFLRIFRSVLLAEVERGAINASVVEREFLAVFVGVLLKYKTSFLKSPFSQPLEGIFPLHQWSYSSWDVIELFCSSAPRPCVRDITVLTWFQTIAQLHESLIYGLNLNDHFALDFFQYFSPNIISCYLTMLRHDEDLSEFYSVATVCSEINRLECLLSVTSSTYLYC